MTGAEYKTYREALGFGTAMAVARFNKVQDRTVRYWESGQAVIPDDVVHRLAALDYTMTRAAEMICEDWRGADFPSPFRLLRYNTEQAFKASALNKVVPFEAHGALINRMRTYLEKAGATVLIEYGD